MCFCREPLPNSDEECNKRLMARIKKNDPVAMCQMGKKRDQEGDYKTAAKYFTKAAELGNASAHYNLSVMYREGDGVEKDDKKEIYHLEEAAIAGDPWARHNLGIKDACDGRFDRAKKHWIIAANLGYHDSLELIKKLYTEGDARKEDYADGLRAYQAAAEAAKSPEREAAEAYYSSRSR